MFIVQMFKSSKIQGSKFLIVSEFDVVWGLEGSQADSLTVPQPNGLADCWTGLLLDFKPSLLLAF
jgi:hypothetical protein